MANANSNLPSVSEMKAYIREQARARGADPNIAVKVAKSEGLQPGVWQSDYYKNGRRETSYGPFQLLVGGGLGDKFIKQTGLDPSDPSSWKEQIQFALDEATQDGWGAWYGAAKVGVGKWDGLKGAEPLGITDTATADTATADTAAAETDPFSILSPDLARPGSARIAESAYSPEAAAASIPPTPSAGREMAAMVVPQMLGAPTGLGQPIQARFDGAPPPALGAQDGLREPNPARFEGTPAAMMGLREPIAARFEGAPPPALAGRPDPIQARFEGPPFPAPNRGGGMQPFGGAPTPGMSPIFDPSKPPPLREARPVETSVFGLPPQGQPVAANNFGLAHGQPGFVGGVPAHEVSYLTQQGERGPRTTAFNAPMLDASRFQFAPGVSATSPELSAMISAGSRPEIAAPADARFSGPSAAKGDRLLNALPSREMFAMADAMRPGIPQGSLPQNPMDAIRDAAPERSIPDIARVMAGKPISPGSMYGPQDVERAKASRPTDGVPYEGPGSVFTAEDAERSKQAWMADGFRTSLDPPAAREFEGGRHRVGLGMGPQAGPDARTPLTAAGQMRAPDLKSQPFGQVTPRNVATTREVRAALPIARGFAPGNLGQFAAAAAASAPAMAAGRAAANSSAASRREPVRIVNPISVGQPGGKAGPGQTYGGTGLAAMMGVRSGMSPVGTVARSASNPDVMNVSLPHGNVAHINQAKGYISTWSPADDDERGTVYGKTLAIDPTGTKSSYVSPSKAQELAAKGWTTYGPNTAPGPGKGFAKSTSRSGPSAGPAQRSGLMGMLSGIFGQPGRGPAGPAGRGGILGLPGPLGLAAGMFGPAGGMGGLGLGGGNFSGGGGGYGNPGFGGNISSNSNYGGL